MCIVSQRLFMTVILIFFLNGSESGPTIALSRCEMKWLSLAEATESPYFMMYWMEVRLGRLGTYLKMYLGPLGISY